MLFTLLISLFFSLPGAASSNSEKIAQNDAIQTFADFEKSIQNLITENTDSLTEFRSKYSALDNQMKNYCNSMKQYKTIYSSCLQKMRSAYTKARNREAFLAKTLKSDKYAEVLKKLKLLRSNTTAQNNGKMLLPHEIKIRFAEQRKELEGYCPSITYTELKKSCYFYLNNLKKQIAEYEQNTKKLTLGSVKNPVKPYTDKTPQFRCYIHLPTIQDTKLAYKITDPSGAYRYTYLTKATTGDYAVNLNLNKFLENKDNQNYIGIEKSFKHPMKPDNYELYIALNGGCSSTTKPLQCKLDSASISISHTGAKGEPQRVESNFVTLLDSPFEIAFAHGEFEQEELRLECALASQMRIDHPLFGDALYEN